MSHTATVKTEFRNRAVVQRAAEALGLECEVGEGLKYEMYDDSIATGDVILKLPGWNYPVVIDTKTGDAKYDNYNGAWGDIARLEEFMQEYTLQVAENEAQEFVLQGWNVSRQKQENGDIQLVIEQ